MSLDDREEGKRRKTWGKSGGVRESGFGIRRRETRDGGSVLLGDIRGIKRDDEYIAEETGVES